MEPIHYLNCNCNDLECNILKNLFAPNGPLSALVFNFNLPGTYSDVAHKPITLSFNFIGQTGTAILLTIIITVLMSKKLISVMQDVCS